MPTRHTNTCAGGTRTSQDRVRHLVISQHVAEPRWRGRLAKSELSVPLNHHENRALKDRVARAVLAFLENYKASALALRRIIIESLNQAKCVIGDHSH